MADAPVDEAELRRPPSLRLCILTFAVVVAVIVVPVLVLGTVADLMRGPTAAVDPKTNGVVVTSCKSDTRGKVQINGTAQNASSESAYFGIVLDVYDRDGNDIGDAEASAFDVLAGQTMKWTARTNVPFDSGATCEASSVLRMPPIPPTS